MKNSLFMAVSFFLFTVCGAQPLQEGKQSYYYERYNKALTGLNTYLQSTPADAEAWYWLALSYAGEEKADEGLNRLKSAPAEVQNEPLFQAALGHLNLVQGNAAAAAPYFEKALDGKGEKNPQLLSAVARAHIDAASGNGQTAVELLDKAIRRDKKNPELYTLLGDAYRKLNNGTEAYKAFKEAIARDENHAAAYYKVGKIFTTQKNPDAYLPYFQDAIRRDSGYAPAYYELYNHYFTRDAAKAMDYFQQYRAKSDPDEEQAYAYTDLLYLNKQYDQAITHAKELLQRQPVQPRLYKLIAYSYEGLKDTATALTYMGQYFANEADSNFVLKDFETMGALYASRPGGEDSAAHYFTRAVSLQKDSVAIFDIYKKVADLYKGAKNFAAEAQWRARYYQNNPRTNNLDLFNWGLAHYRAEEYAAADSVFGLYVAAYPEQGFGYYWQARAASLTDPEMQQGVAVPRYQKLIEVLQQGTPGETEKRWLIEAYSYLAAYETNTQKDYTEAIQYFNKVLELDPENATAKKYIDVLEKNVAASQGSK